MTLLAERIPVPAGALLFIGGGVFSLLTPAPWLLIPATLTLSILPCWWVAHRRREREIRDIRALLDCHPSLVAQMEEPW